MHVANQVNSLRTAIGTPGHRRHTYEKVFAASGTVPVLLDAEADLVIVELARRLLLLLDDPPPPWAATTCRVAATMAS